jgi:hypothetical protein
MLGICCGGTEEVNGVFFHRIHSIQKRGWTPPLTALELTENDTHVSMFPWVWDEVPYQSYRMAWMYRKKVV